MSKSKKRNKTDDDERQERALANFKLTGNTPTPGLYPETSEKQQQRKNRKHERNRLRNIAKEFNNG